MPCPPLRSVVRRFWCEIGEGRTVAEAAGAVDVLRRFVRLIPLTLAFIALTNGSCVGVAVIVSHWASVSLSDAYLATTPGGIYGVLAIANEVHSGPIVVTLQVLRLVTMVVAAGMIPKLIGWLDHQRSRRSGSSSETSSQAIPVTASAAA